MIDPAEEAKKLLNDIDNANKNLAKYYFDLYMQCFKQGFSEKQAMDILLITIHEMYENIRRMSDNKNRDKF